MAKESMKARERKRARMVEKYAAKRAALKKAGEWEKLQQLPANGSKVRMHNRCQISGRFILAFICQFSRAPGLPGRLTPDLEFVSLPDQHDLLFQIGKVPQWPRH